MVKNIYPKIGGRLRLAHEENDQLSITTEIIKCDENLAVVRAITTMKRNFPGLSTSSIDRDHTIAWATGKSLRPAQKEEPQMEMTLGFDQLPLFIGKTEVAA